MTFSTSRGAIRSLSTSEYRSTTSDGDRFYHFTMELLAKIIGPFEIIVQKQAPHGAGLKAKPKG
jgi:hypothetical protein